MIRIEYGVPVLSNKGYGVKYYRKSVIFADDIDEADDICRTCDKLSYPIYNISNYIEEAD